MSTFTKMTKNPKTGKFEKALWMDDHFAHYHYGVRFEDGSVVDPEAINLEVRNPMSHKEIQSLKNLLKNT